MFICHYAGHTVFVDSNYNNMWFLCWALLQESDYSFTSDKDNPEARPPPPFPPDVPSSDSEDVMYILNVV